jgi:polysaccharide export outer membrane protein
LNTKVYLNDKSDPKRMENMRQTSCLLWLGLAIIACITPLLSACSSAREDWLASSGPSRSRIGDAREDLEKAGIQFVEINGDVARQLLASQKQNLFSEAFGKSSQAGYVIGAGDVVEVSLWEAPPAMLFAGSSGGGGGDSGAPATARVATFPEQMVSREGTINIPFAGQVRVVGSTPRKAEEEIVRRLRNKANQPQVLVRVTRNATADVTVVGEVEESKRMPLTAKGERLLDALAAAGGGKVPVNKMTLQVTRGNKVAALPLDRIINDPQQNVLLQPGDVITALHQPLHMIALGSVAEAQEINFEVQGISLAQALGRTKGLNDTLADAKGVFIFRFEDAGALDWPLPPRASPEGKVPVIYQVNLKNPATFFVAQSFPMRNDDLLYVANAPAAELQKFLNIILSATYPFLNLLNMMK